MKKDFRVPFLQAARIRRGGRKKPVRKGIINGKPKSQGVIGLKMKKSLRAVAEQRVGKKLGNLRVLNSLNRPIV